MKMLKHLYIIIIATFLFGFITGIIVFLLTSDGLGSNSTVRDFDGGVSVIVRIYGGCQMAGVPCPSYRISPSGAYAYIEPTRQLEPYRGEMAEGEWSQLKTLILNEKVSQKYPPFTGTCPIAYDGSAFEYEITAGNKTYLIDSCESDLEGRVLFEKLEDYFRIFQTIHRK